MITDINKQDQVVEQYLALHLDKIVKKYVKKHGLDAAHVVTGDMVRTHFYTERRLAHDILSASKEDRAAIAEQAYTEFYAKCFWLDAFRNNQTERDEELSFGPILYILKKFGPKVYEVGSGSGRLAAFLSRHSFDCIATDISSERQKRASSSMDGLVWHVSDGINLARHEPQNHYDIVVSSQVVEHLHPDDIHNHFTNAFSILKTGGAYVFNTPHSFTGPNDISEIFKMDRSQCFHLKEYTYTELSRILKSAGFRRIMAVYVVPKQVRARLRMVNRPIISSTYLQALILAESALGRLGSKTRRNMLRLPIAVALWRPEVFLVAVK